MQEHSDSDRMYVYGLQLQSHFMPKKESILLAQNANRVMHEARVRPTVATTLDMAPCNSVVN